MANGWYIWKQKSSCTLLLLLLLIACKHKKALPLDISDYDLRSGDIVCRLGNGFFSKYFKEFASKEQRYSHIGLVEVTQDTIFVIHTEASELTGVGFVKREPIARFLEKITVFGFYRITATDALRQRIIAKVNSYYKDKVPFDMDFKTADDSELYCTELVARAINYAFDSIVIRPELQLGSRKFYSLDAIYQHPLAQKLKKHRN